MEDRVATDSQVHQVAGVNLDHRGRGAVMDVWDLLDLQVHRAVQEDLAQQEPRVIRVRQDSPDQLEDKGRRVQQERLDVLVSPDS
jgi:tRNA(Leu) C34 or U34 (ribose-2'-O)-methylase TrmL